MGMGKRFQYTHSTWIKNVSFTSITKEYSSNKPQVNKDYQEKDLTTKHKSPITFRLDFICSIIFVYLFNVEVPISTRPLYLIKDLHMA